MKLGIQWIIKFRPHILFLRKEMDKNREL